jgi:type II secretory pathway component PulF
MAIEHIESGAHWTEALHAVGLITKPQVSVIRSAERADNLSWALNEMADSTIRLTAHRTNAVLSFVFPACLLAIGFCVLLIVVGMMLPLFDLIGSLA